MKIIRWVLGRIILLVNALFSPKPINRSSSEQKKVDEAMAFIRLYQFEACPFCVKVRRAAKRLNLPLETRNAKKAPWEQDLINGGGQRKVPCLRIENDTGEVKWMYESSDIIAYLEKRFA